MRWRLPWKKKRLINHYNMALLLNIDTATEHASVCLSDNENILGLIESTEQKNHASFVQAAVKELMKNAGTGLQMVNAVAVSAGPGSYTGLRVGLASAKGICYALGKPLIMVNTLEIIARAMFRYLLSKEKQIDPSLHFCPMIDARRMEVFTATYNSSLEETEAPNAKILDETSFAEQLLKGKVVFSGTGHHKFQKLVSNPSAVFLDLQHDASHLASLALNAYQSKCFADLAYSEPLYVKAFFNPAKQS